MTDPVIDLSHWNELEGDGFEHMASAGVLGVIHKATEGAGYVDPTYADRRRQAEAAGLLWGAYHFLRPGDMRAQAQHFVKYAGSDVGLLYAADHEDPEVPLAGLKEFMRIVHDLTGHVPVLYSGFLIKEQLGTSIDAELAQYRLWLAHYNKEPSWPNTWPTWWLHQYTDTGSVPGVSGNVDCNRHSGNTADLREAWGANGAVPIGPTVTVTIEAPPNVIVNVVRL